MSHEVESMMYYGEMPWHKLGTAVGAVATAEEAIKAAGLDWEVETAPIYHTKQGEITPINEYRVVRRATDKQVYSIVGLQYNPIQNRECFAFFDEVTQTGEAKYHTAGALRYGARVWMMAKLKGPIGIKGEQIDKYIVLLNTHDGSSALQMFWTPIRVVCMNTLQMALSSSAQRFYARHTRGYKGKMDTAQEILGLADVHYKEWAAQARRLAELKFNQKRLDTFLNETFGYKMDIARKEIYQPIQRDMATIENLLHDGKGMDNPAIQGTRWQLYNAVVEYVDYYRKPRGDTIDRRLDSAWFGTGAEIKSRAWNALIKA